MNMKFNRYLNTDFSFNIFHSKTYNLIQWRPIQSYWKAENIDDVTRYGFSGYLTQNSKLLTSKISFSISESFHGINKKELRYTPKILELYFLKKI